MWTCLSVSLSSPDLICFNRRSSQTFAAYKLLTTDPVRFTNSLTFGLIWRAVPDFSVSLVLELSRIYVSVERERIFHAVSLFALVISSQLQRNTKTFANITETKRKQTFVFVSCCTAFCAIRKTFSHKKLCFSIHSTSLIDAFSLVNAEIWNHILQKRFSRKQISAQFHIRIWQSIRKFFTCFGILSSLHQTHHQHHYFLHNF